MKQIQKYTKQSFPIYICFRLWMENRGGDVVMRVLHWISQHFFKVLGTTETKLIITLNEREREREIEFLYNDNSNVNQNEINCWICFWLTSKGQLSHMHLLMIVWGRLSVYKWYMLRKTDSAHFLCTAHIHLNICTLFRNSICMGYCVYRTYLF